MKKLSRKQIERNVNDIFRRIGEGVQVPIMSLGTVLSTGERSLQAGETLELAETKMQAALDAVRAN
jgi:hypothetical protein